MGPPVMLDVSKHLVHFSQLLGALLPQIAQQIVHLRTGGVDGVGEAQWCTACSEMGYCRDECKWGDFVHEDVKRLARVTCSRWYSFRPLTLSYDTY